MAHMTAAGTVLTKAGEPGETLTIALGDTVLLKNGMEGVASRWTSRGVAVRVWPRVPPATVDSMEVLTLNAGDGDVIRVLRKCGEG